MGETVGAWRDWGAVGRGEGVVGRRLVRLYFLSIPSRNNSVYLTYIFCESKEKMDTKQFCY